MLGANSLSLSFEQWVSITWYHNLPFTTHGKVKGRSEQRCKRLIHRHLFAYLIGQRKANLIRHCNRFITNPPPKKKKHQMCRKIIKRKQWRMMLVVFQVYRSLVWKTQTEKGLSSLTSIIVCFWLEQWKIYQRVQILVLFDKFTISGELLGT